MEQEALMRGDTAGPAAEGNGGGNGSPANGVTNGGATAPPRTSAPAASAPKPPTSALTDDPPVTPAALQGLDLGPACWPVRRHDAADGLLLHVLELREQHGLRVAPGARSRENCTWATGLRGRIDQRLFTLQLNPGRLP